MHAFDDAQQLVGVSCLGDNLLPATLEYAGDPLPNKNVVVRDDDPRVRCRLHDIDYPLATARLHDGDPPGAPREHQGLGRADETARQCVQDQLGTCGHVQLPENVRSMRVDGSHRDEELGRDLQVGVAEREQMQNVALPW